MISIDNINGEFLLKTLMDGVQIANRSVHRYNQDNRIDMGTTITAALVFAYAGSAFISSVLLWHAGAWRACREKEPDLFRTCNIHHAHASFLLPRYGMAPASGGFTGYRPLRSRSAAC